MWISIEDMLPKVGDYVLTVNSKGYMNVSKEVGLAQDVIGKYNSSFYRSETDCDVVCACIGGGWSMGITHWMPLPEPPEAD